MKKPQAPEHKLANAIFFNSKIPPTSEVGEICKKKPTEAFKAQLACLGLFSIY